MESDGTQASGIAPIGHATTPASGVQTNRPRVWLASELIGTPVVGRESEKLGKIDDVVVHPGGHSSYLVLSIGGWLGMGDKLFAMPFTSLQALESSAFATDQPRSLVLPLSKEQLASAPGFDKQAWPNLTDPEWAHDVDRFYAGRANSNGPEGYATTKSEISGALRVSNLDGHAVKNQLDEKLGDIDEIAVDTRGRVRYAVLSVGGFLGMGDKLIAVPWDSLAFSNPSGGGEYELITLATTKERLASAPQFKPEPEHVWEMRDAGWIARIYKHFETPVR